MDWRDHWERYSDEEKKAMDIEPVAGLLRQIAMGRYGNYYNIWYSVAERAEPGAAIPVLMREHGRMDDRLHQFHCAVAILHLLGDEPLVRGSYPPDTTAASYTSGTPGWEDARRDLSARVQKKLGGQSQ